MILGRFAENPKSGKMIGHIRTLFFKADKVVFEPTASDNAKAPSHRIYTVDEVELGSAWRRASTDGIVHYDVTLDDPTFAAPIYARLDASKDKNRPGFILFWNRPAKNKSA